MEGPYKYFRGLLVILKYNHISLVISNKQKSEHTEMLSVPLKNSIMEAKIFLNIVIVFSLFTTKNRKCKLNKNLYVEESKVAVSNLERYSFFIISTFVVHRKKKVLEWHEEQHEGVNNVEHNCILISWTKTYFFFLQNISSFVLPQN